MGRAHGTRRCAKRICCRSGNGGFAACSGRKSTGTFFSLHIYSSIQAFFFNFCVSTSGLNTTRPTLFSFWEWGGRLLPYSCSEKRPGYVANAPGALFWNYFMERSGGRLLRSLRYVHTTDTSTRPPWHVYNVCVVPSYIKSTYRTACTLIAVLLLLYKRGSGP